MLLTFTAVIFAKSECTKYGCPIDAGPSHFETIKKKIVPERSRSASPLNDHFRDYEYQKPRQRSYPISPRYDRSESFQNFEFPRSDRSKKYVAVPLNDGEKLFIIDSYGNSHSTFEQIAVKKTEERLYVYNTLKKSFRPADPQKLPRGFYVFSKEKCEACDRLKLASKEKGIILNPFYIQKNSSGEIKAYTTTRPIRARDASIWLELYQKQFPIPKIRNAPVPFSVDSEGNFIRWSPDFSSNGVGFKIPNPRALP